MSQPNILPMSDPTAKRAEVVMMTPEWAAALLKLNVKNRPLSPRHIARIARQIRTGKWRFNASAFGVDTNGNFCNGQHRAAAIVETGIAVETVIVYGIPPDAFATIDAILKPRSGTDILHLDDVHRHGWAVKAALKWLVLIESDAVPDYRLAENRVENSDIQAAHHDNPGMVAAVDRAMILQGIVAVSLVACISYLVANLNPALAERMMATLMHPHSVGITDPFCRLSVFFTSERRRQKQDSVQTLALIIKACNAAHAGRTLDKLTWRSSGRDPEPFPTLDVC